MLNHTYEPYFTGFEAQKGQNKMIQNLNADANQAPF